LAAIFHESLPFLTDLITDVFGNYIVQSLIQYGTEEMIAAICDQILGKMVHLTRNKYGCRVIQKAFDFTDSI